VPKLYMVDEAAGWMMMEWVEGEPVRAKVNEWLRLHTPSSIIAEETAAVADNENSVQHAAALTSLMARIGVAVGRLHAVSIVHGDLTTSNMILRPWPRGSEPANGHAEADGLLDGEIVLIDFGLASQATQEEERAVDLYVLERAFASTHPRAEVLFSVVLQSYKETFKDAASVLRRLEEVRMRGRKRSMVG
jgi:TP53 regulating kinase and related kinases